MQDGDEQDFEIFPYRYGIRIVVGIIYSESFRSSLFLNWTRRRDMHRGIFEKELWNQLYKVRDGELCAADIKTRALRDERPLHT